MARVSSITRVLQIVEAVSAAQRPLSPLDLSEILDIPKPTMHRLIQQLQEEGFVRVDINGTIVAASRTRHMAIHLWQSQQVAIQRYAILQKLVDSIGETCGMAVPFYVNMVYTDRVPCPSALQVYMPTDSAAPMWCTAAGKMYLSTLPKDERATLIKNLSMQAITPATITDTTLLNQSLDQTAKLQYAISDEEYIAQAVSIAVAINDTQGRYIGSLYTTAPKSRKSVADLIQYVPDMHKAASAICDAFFGDF